MYVNKYVVNNFGTKWRNGRSKKNQLLDSLEGTDGIFIKRLVPLLEQWYETVNGEYPSKVIEMTINVKDEDRQ
tara:strand:- start:146 stop:364 length:219 start_codon:yes stop_codon:yes gene_type:complete